ncbi:hypothetical protein V6N13_129687 [Hibiscus sabdariffa]
MNGTLYEVQRVEKIVQSLGEVGGSSIAKPEWKLIDQSLSFYPPVDNNGSILVQPPPDFLLNGTKQWSNALVGNFLATALKHHLEFAKLCVNVSAVTVLPPSVLVDLGQGNTIDIVVELVWSPPCCSHCCIFGHGEENYESGNSGTKVVGSLDIIEFGGNENASEFVSNVDGFGSYFVGNEDDDDVNGVVAPLSYVVGDVRHVEIEVSSPNRFGRLCPGNDDGGVSVVSPSKVWAATEASNITKERVVVAELNELLLAEESIFRHKSRIQGVNEGDQNSGYFFRQVAMRNKANTIFVLYDEQGTKLEMFEVISNELV